MYDCTLFCEGCETPKKAVVRNISSLKFNNRLLMNVIVISLILFIVGVSALVVHTIFRLTLETISLKECIIVIVGLIFCWTGGFMFAYTGLVMPINHNDFT